MLVLIEEDLRELARPAERAGIERDEPSRSHLGRCEVARAALCFGKQIQRTLVSRVAGRPLFEHVARALCVSDVQQRGGPLRAQRQTLRPFLDGAGKRAGSIAPAAGVLIHLPKRAVELWRVLNRFLQQRDGVGIAVGGLVCLREHRNRLDLIGLIGDKRSQHRNGLVVLAISDVETPEHRRYTRVGVATGLFQIGNRTLRVGAPIRLPRVRHFRDPRVQTAQNPVRFGIRRIGFHCALTRGYRLGRPVEARVQLGERSGNFRRCRIEPLGALIRGGRARAVALRLEMQAHHELVVGAARGICRRRFRLRKGRSVRPQAAATPPRSISASEV